MARSLQSFSRSGADDAIDPQPVGRLELAHRLGSGRSEDGVLPPRIETGGRQVVLETKHRITTSTPAQLPIGHLPLPVRPYERSAGRKIDALTPLSCDFPLLAALIADRAGRAKLLGR